MQARTSGASLSPSHQSSLASNAAGTEYFGSSFIWSCQGHHSRSTFYNVLDHMRLSHPLITSLSSLTAPIKPIIRDSSPLFSQIDQAPSSSSPHIPRLTHPDNLIYSYYKHIVFHDIYKAFSQCCLSFNQLVRLVSWPLLLLSTYSSSNTPRQPHLFILQAYRLSLYS